MAILQAIILGIIEGLTEFLPISSTGHLIVGERALGYKDAAELFTVVVQLGAIAAVIWHYRRDLYTKTLDLFQGKNKARTFWRNWIVATIPAGLVGFVFDEKVSRFATVKTVSIALIVGGLAILLIETYHRPKPPAAKVDLGALSLKQSLQVGVYQILALVPGVSRSGATIMGGLLSGLDRVTATAFSFYLSIPLLVLASGYKLVKESDKISQISGGTSALLLGVVTAFISALLAINWLLKYVAHHDFKGFAWYRIGFGIVILLTLARW